VPFRPIEGSHPSGSSSTYFAPGVIGIGNHDHPLSLCDSLVHEASHQHFYIARRLGPVDDGTDTTEYINPIIGVPRPISKILLAYHAFANIALFCQEVHAREASEYLAARLERIVQWLDVLDTALHTTRALTPIGEALWQPLHERIFRLDCG
jgi:HEXXH motif-containing protein